MNISILFFSSLSVAVATAGQSTNVSNTPAQVFAGLEPAIQGAVIGGGAALIGTALTMAVTAGVTWLQLRHATRQRDKDRALELKKEVLLAAVDGLNATTGTIAQMANVDASDQLLLDQFQFGNQQTIRAGAVAAHNTIRALAVMRREVAMVYMRLLPERHRLMGMKTDADVAVQGVERALSEQIRLAALREQLVLQGADHKHIQYVEGMWEFAVKTHDTLSGERDRLNSMLMEHRKAFTRVCMREHLGLQTSHAAFVQCVRVETGVDVAGDQSYASATKVDETEVFGALDSAFHGLGADDPVRT